MKRDFNLTTPVVRLRNYTPQAYDDAIAAARTCYSMDVINAKEVTAKQRDYIGPLTFDAGHHTVYQHATFEFSLENVSRHFVWSILHSFPYYNSDQQSQRYVRLNDLRAFTPPYEGELLEIYRRAIIRGFAVYDQLTEALMEDTTKIVGQIRHLDKHPHPRLKKKVDKEAQKKAIEIARYVLPIATHTSLVYTCSGLVLHRLWRLMNTGDLTYESKQIIGAMVAAAEAVEADFFKKIGDGPLAENIIPETPFYTQPQAYHAAEWDEDFKTYDMSVLMDYTVQAEKIAAKSARFALGPGAKSMTDAELIDLMLNPKNNRYRIEKVNVSTHSPLMRSLEHVRYTFLKRLSHTADSQNQRHRTVQGSRPFFSSVDSDTPDYYIPMLIQQSPKALEIYKQYMDEVWETKQTLISKGMDRSFALYILPNAARVRFVESGSLLNLLHKWTLRTCLNAQEEIYHASMEELKQVVEVHPFLKKFIGPPCVIRNGLVSPRCTEGDRFCGTPVWKTFPNVERRL